MKISAVVAALENLASPSLQESYDNAGLLTGDQDWECSGILCCLDVTEEIIEEAVASRCNMVVSHHPLIFGNLKRLTNDNHVNRTLISAIRQNVAVYSIHTNLDNVIEGVNGKIAALIGLEKLSVLQPKPNSLKKLYTFVPNDNADKVRQAIFDAGGGQIGKYSECSFNSEGTGTFKANKGTDPYVGKIGETHFEKEIRLEIIFPSNLEKQLIGALKAAHPYEEVAYDIIQLSNVHPGIGSGLLGQLSSPMKEKTFLELLKKKFNLHMIRHSALINKDIKTVAVCGGAGSFLIFKALACGADAYVTSDIKYHQFFEAEGRVLITDIGHYESEQFTIDLLQEVIAQKFPTFAVLKTAVNTNPVHYF